MDGWRGGEFFLLLPFRALAEAIGSGTVSQNQSNGFGIISYYLL